MFNLWFFRVNIDSLLNTWTIPFMSIENLKLIMVQFLLSICNNEDFFFFKIQGFWRFKFFERMLLVSDIQNENIIKVTAWNQIRKCSKKAPREMVITGTLFFFFNAMLILLLQEKNIGKKCRNCICLKGSCTGTVKANPLRVTSVPGHCAKCKLQ